MVKMIFFWIQFVVIMLHVINYPTMVYFEHAKTCFTKCKHG